MCVCKDTHAQTHTCTHTQNGILLSHNKNKTMPLVTTWMDLEISMLSDVSQGKTKVI